MHLASVFMPPLAERAKALTTLPVLVLIVVMFETLVPLMDVKVAADVGGRAVPLREG